MILEATPENIDYCARLLQRDEIIGIPTETVYGLGGNALREKSVRKIFQVKNRPLIDPLIVHCKNLETAESVAVTNDALRTLAKVFWPGPLTLIVTKNKCVPDRVTAGLASVAIRVPRHPVFQSLLAKVDFPLAAPSANPFGFVSPTLAAHVKQTLGSQIEAILDGGPCSIGLESTIIDLRTPETPVVLRKGPITHSQISQCLGVPVSDAIAVSSNDTTAQRAPGQLTRHYSPETEIELLEHGSTGQRESLAARLDNSSALVCNQKPDWYTKQSNVYWLSKNGNIDEMAHNLFDLIQKLDRQSLQKIYIEKAPPEAIGLAINDRLKRAAAKS